MTPSSLRVIGGRLKGRRLAGPTWDGLRPTSDRLRETLFNVLAARLDGARWIDACAGTGAIGIEALSRGAVHVTFVEADRRALALIVANLRHCGVEGGYTMCPRTVADAAARLPPAGADIIYLDPPYGADDADDMVTGLAERVAPGGILVVEHAKRRDMPERCGRAVKVRTLVSGDSALSFYEQREDELTSGARTARRPEAGGGDATLAPEREGCRVTWEQPRSALPSIPDRSIR